MKSLPGDCVVATRDQVKKHCVSFYLHHGKGC